jgi:rare lipoprotein A
VRTSACALAVLLAGCAAAPVFTPEPAKPVPQKGGYYKDDGPGDNPPANLERIADAVPRIEPLHRYANRPYNRFGKDYVPITAVGPFRQTGIASWYGRRFHGQPTSSGEPYDMYAMTAAHPTLPIPSYARVSNPANRRSVVVRVNDRGPFHDGRIIDLSYAAAWKLGIVEAGSGLVVVEAIVPGKVAGASGQNSGSILSVR